MHIDSRRKVSCKSACIRVMIKMVEGTPYNLQVLYYQIYFVKPETLHPSPQTLHYTPYTLNPPPFTLNPEPQTLQPQP